MRFACIPLAAALAALFALPAEAVVADRETPGLAEPADADDPAIWLHPTDPARSLVITAVKDAGGRVYDLGAALVQSLDPFPSSDGQNSRYNNIDVQYGFRLHDGSRVDIAVASDRGQDVFRVWRIDPNDAVSPLKYVGTPDPARAFPDLPDGSPNPLADQNTAYGVALYRDVAADRMYVLATQREQSRLAQYELVANPDGTVGTQLVRDFRFPGMLGGSVNLAGRQFEGLVVDQQTGLLYAGQEEVGIWRVDLNTGIQDTEPFALAKGFDATSPLTADVEGLTIYYAANGTGYLLASSQGDNSFAVFDRQGLAYLGSFGVMDGAATDGVQGSDGADVTPVGLPGYPSGLFVTQDGAEGRRGTNFKYVSWGEIAGELGLRVDTTAYDPRHPLAAIPEPDTWVMLLAGLGMVGLAGRLRRRTA